MPCLLFYYIPRTVVLWTVPMDIYALIILLPLALTQALPSATKQYRTDYEYNDHTDAFYKLHIEERSTEHAKERCRVEGAELMLPVTQRDIQQVHAMLKRYPDLGDIVLVATDNQEHDPVDETVEQDPLGSVCEAVTRDSGELRSLECWRRAPFVCKVDAQAAPYDEQCDVFGKNYVSMISTTGSCYKIPPIEFTWNEALAECAAERAHLIVLNSEGEHEVIRAFMNNGQLPQPLKLNYFFFAGIRADRPKDGTPRVFRTVNNQTLEEAGYTAWSENEPNNYQDSEYCGSLFKNDGKYNDLACTDRHAFICEKEMRAV